MWGGVEGCGLVDGRMKVLEEWSWIFFYGISFARCCGSGDMSCVVGMLCGEE